MSSQSRTESSHCSPRSLRVGARAKRVASVTAIDAHPRKRVNRAASNGSSRAEVDGEPDDHLDAASDYTPELDTTNSTGEEGDLEELEEILGKSHTPLPSLLLTLLLSQG
jgi:hypothetical protein